jgi:Na+/phosphate symporter
MKEKCDDLLYQIHAMGTGAGECLTCLQKTLTGNSPEAAMECLEKLAAVRAREPEMMAAIASSTQTVVEKESLKDIVRHFLRICGHLEDMAETLRKKARANVLFSDRGVTEVSFLSQALTDILKAAADLVLVRNPVLIRYVLESEAMVEKMTIEYATQHEERLIEGLCLPLAAPVYLSMLDTFKGIAREAKGIAEKISA